jgi:uncharacterized membrane protein YedE/YeeE
VTDAILGLAVGAAFGALAARGTVCFNAGVRRAAFERRFRILRVFAVAVAAQLLLLPLLDVAGVDPLTRAVETGQPPLLPVAQVVGGFAFGIGMALAGGCIAGILWKSGAGSLATAIAIGGFAAGELLVRGPGDGLLAELDAAGPRPEESSLHDIVGLPYGLLAPVAGAIALVLLVRRSRSGVTLGAAVGVVAAAAWLAADAAGYGYGLGFTGAADNVRDSLPAGDFGRLSFQAFLAVGVIAGAALALRGPLRVPDGARAARAFAGGTLMGVGANVAHGCNIGHGLAGIPLLSLGSLLATALMAAGVVVAWRFLLAPSPALRGAERPEPSW